MCDSTYLSIKFSDNVPETISSKDILYHLSQLQVMPEEIEISGHRLALKHIPATKPVYKLFESKNLHDETVEGNVNEITNSFMGTIHVNLLAPTRQH